jgi:hypothetical protein
VPSRQEKKIIINNENQICGIKNYNKKENKINNSIIGPTRRANNKK